MLLLIYTNNITHYTLTITNTKITYTLEAANQSLIYELFLIQGVLQLNKMETTTTLAQFNRFIQLALRDVSARKASIKIIQGEQ